MNLIKRGHRKLRANVQPIVSQYVECDRVSLGVSDFSVCVHVWNNNDITDSIYISRPLEEITLKLVVKEIHKYFNN